MINQWSTIEEISCAPDGAPDGGGGSSGSFGYSAVWLALAAGNSNGSSVRELPCISSGQQVLEQFNIRQVSDRDDHNNIKVLKAQSHESRHWAERNHQRMIAASHVFIPNFLFIGSPICRLHLSLILLCVPVRMF